MRENKETMFTAIRYPVTVAGFMRAQIDAMRMLKLKNVPAFCYLSNHELSTLVCDPYSRMWMVVDDGRYKLNGTTLIPSYLEQRPLKDYPYEKGNVQFID